MSPANSQQHEDDASPEPPPPPPSGRRLAELPLERADERVFDKTARWMGLLGRFQVLGGGLVLVIALLMSGGWFVSSVTAAEAESDTTPPLVRLGEVSSTEMGIAVAAVVLVGALVLAGGVLFTDAAEDLEHVEHAEGDRAARLEDAFRTLAKAFVIDSALIGIAAALLVWLGSLA